MGKFHNEAIFRQIAPQVDDEPEQMTQEEAWELSYSDWKWNKDDDLASAVRRYARPVCRVRVWDEVEVGR